MTRRFVAALALCGLSITTAACGGSDDDTAVTTTTTASENTASSSTLAPPPAVEVWKSVQTAPGDPEWCGPMMGYRQYNVDALGSAPEPGDTAVYETNARAATETAATPGLPTEYVDALNTVVESNQTAAALAAGTITELTPEQEAVGQQSMQIFDLVGRVAERCPATAAVVGG